MSEQQRPKTVKKKNPKQNLKETQSFGFALLLQKSVGSKVGKKTAVSRESSLGNVPPVIHAEFRKGV